MIILLMSLLFILSCGYLYQIEWLTVPDENSLTGRVVLETGRGFDDVDATLSVLGEDGEAEQSWALTLSSRGEFRDEDLTPGNFRLDIIKPRYDPYSYQFSLAEGERIYLEVELMRYSIPDEIWDVRVVGDFLDWDPQRAVPMEAAGGNGRWQVSIPLPSGRYSYAYIINGLEERFIDIDSGIYESDERGYYHSVLILDQARQVDFHLDTNDSWYRRASFDVPIAERSIGWAIWEPEEPRQGQEVSILYDARGGPLEGARQVLLHWGINGWNTPSELPTGAGEYGDGRAVQSLMDPLSQETWWVVIPTDETVGSVDFIFTDGQGWDDNASNQWHIPVIPFGQADTSSQTGE